MNLPCLSDESTSMDIETSVVGVQTPNYLSSRTRRKVTLLQKLKNSGLRLS